MRAGLTKRQLGLLLVAMGVGAAGLLLAVDLLGAGRSAGIGPAQRMALGGAALLVLVGLTLLPLGDRPA
ncbi:MAG: hypothetical protein GX579_21115 [Chloroflexi bacterium]|jgi:hypothetical protein|nr:hypothetical protein [Chloroflexota bacterium]